MKDCGTASRVKGCSSGRFVAVWWKRIQWEKNVTLPLAEEDDIMEEWGIVSGGRGVSNGKCVQECSTALLTGLVIDVYGIATNGREHSSERVGHCLCWTMERNRI